MSTFHYEHWTVRITDESGTLTHEFKGRSKAHVVHQIERLINKAESPENLSKPALFRLPRILSVDWGSLTLDRTGHDRRF